MALRLVPVFLRRFMTTQSLLIMLCGAAGMLLSACGGGTSSDSDTLTPNSSAVAALKPTSKAEAARFLTQATFGPVDADIDRVMAVGYQGWIKEQMGLPMALLSHQAFWDQRNAAIMAEDPKKRAGPFEVSNSFWRQAISGPDQLRQRVAFALSQIFVLSMADGCGADQSQGVAAYLDMLGQRAFGSYRALLESVALHPVMGCFLSHLKNQKEDLVTGRVPDENFAREVMQLFSIGLYELNMDGTRKLDWAGRPIDTYGPSDVSGLAKVFTGFSWDCPGWPSDGCFKWGTRDGDYAKSPQQFTAPMRPYAQFHSTSEKRFLKTVIPIQSTASPEASLKAALDALAAHANVAPFISKQMIQRLVTSNPSPAYVERVATAFRKSDLNLGAMVTAILMDPEARDSEVLTSRTAGKVREPILKFTALLRAYGAKSETGHFIIGFTNNPANSLGQSPMMAPSVFNFYRPGYVPPGSNASMAGLLAPELQLLTETVAAGYVNFMRDVIWAGVGYKGYAGTAAKPDVQLEFNTSPSATLNLADDPPALVESINQRLMYGTMPASMRDDIAAAIATIDYRDKISPTADQIFGTRQRRVWSALLLTVASPEYQVQL